MHSLTGLIAVEEIFMHSDTYDLRHEKTNRPAPHLRCLTEESPVWILAFCYMWVRTAALYVIQ